MPDLIVFSWNIQVFSKNKILNRNNFLEDISNRIHEDIHDRSKGDDIPFIGAILEAKFQQHELPEVIQDFQKKLRDRGLDKVEIAAHETGGSTYTNEYIIRISRGVDVKTIPLGFRDHMAVHIADNRNKATEKFVSQQKTIYDTHYLRKDAKSRQKDSNLPTVPKVEHHFATQKGPEWFRNGFIFEVNAPSGRGKATRIGVIHSSSPDRGREDLVKNSFRDLLDKSAIDMLIGDLNLFGQLTHNSYYTAEMEQSTGTTLQKKNPQEAGTHAWDRVIAHNDLRDYLSSVKLSFGFSKFDEPLSDHGLISVRLKDRGDVVHDNPFASFSFRKDKPFQIIKTSKISRDINFFKTVHDLEMNDTPYFDPFQKRKTSEDDSMTDYFVNNKSRDLKIISPIENNNILDTSGATAKRGLFDAKSDIGSMYLSKKPAETAIMNNEAIGDNVFKKIKTETA